MGKTKLKDRHQNSSCVRRTGADSSFRDETEDSCRSKTAEGLSPDTDDENPDRGLVRGTISLPSNRDDMGLLPAPPAVNGRPAVLGRECNVLWDAALLEGGREIFLESNRGITNGLASGVPFESWFPENRVE
jgi:hypothetical protein